MAGVGRQASSLAMAASIEASEIDASAVERAIKSAMSSGP
jgi:hypothetical protein